MNNQEKIKALQEQLEILREQIESIADEEEEHTSVFPAMLPDSGSYCLEIYNFQAENNCDLVTYSSTDHDQNTFPSEEVAKQYAEAFRVMLQLRRCEGAGHYVEGCDCAYTFDTNHQEVIGEDSDCLWAYTIVPPFPTEELAQAAIDKVGKERIIAAYKLLANVKD